MKKIILIDGYGFVFRAYHSLPPLSRPDGTPVGAVYGFINMLIKLIASLDSSHLAVVLDAGSKTFRHQIYDKYKANRPPCPEDLKPQFPIIRQAVEALNIKVLEKAGFEADDIIATLSSQAQAQDFEVVIVSSDKDLMQLVDKNIKMYDAFKNKTIDFPEVLEKFMVSPKQVCDVLALIGDASDNIPGVKGIGPKNASDFINQFNNIENLYENIEQIKNANKKQLLINDKENAFLSKKLAQLDHFVELDLTINDLQIENIDPHKLLKFLEIQGFKSLIYKVQREFKIDNSKILETESKPDSSNQNNQQIPVKITSIESLKNLEEIHKIAEKKGNILLSYILNENKISQIFLCPFGTENECIETFLVNIKNSIENSNLDLLNFTENSNENIGFSLEDLDQILFDNSIRKLFYDSKEFLRIYHNFCTKKYQKFAQNPWIFDDIKQMNYIISSANHFKLLDLIQNFANSNFFDINFMDKIDKIEKDDFNDKIFFNDETVKANFFANLNYAKIQIYENLAQKITEQNLHHNYLKLELPLLNCLAELEFNGILVDEEKLRNLSVFFSKKIHEISAEIYKLTGEEFNIASSKQLGEILFQKMQIEPTKKSKKTQAFSTDNKVLEELSFHGHEIADKIIDFRKFSKLKNTYSDSLPKQINPITKRIHSHFSASTTLTGRLSSFNPNLQNIPIKTLEGKKIRECFIAKKDYMFLSVDYSQIELRILAHFAQIPELISAFENDKDIHIATASQIFNIPESEVSSELRSKAKAINFGIIYGISAFGLARQLGISNRDASNYIKSYFEKYQGIKDFMNKTIESAQINGFITTISGRKCFIKDIKSKNPILKAEAQRQAINAPIQGSSADIIKKAMIKIHKIMKNKKMQSKMILQIHDELIFETTANEIEDLQKILDEEMINSYPLSVKLKLDFQKTGHW